MLVSSGDLGECLPLLLNLPPSHLLPTPLASTHVWHGHMLSLWGDLLTVPEISRAPVVVLYQDIQSSSTPWKVEQFLLMASSSMFWKIKMQHCCHRCFCRTQHALGTGYGHAVETWLGRQNNFDKFDILGHLWKDMYQSNVACWWGVAPSQPYKHDKYNREHRHCALPSHWTADTWQNTVLKVSIIYMPQWIKPLLFEWKTAFFVQWLKRKI